MSNHGFTQMDTDSMRAPFPWFGGKSRAAELVWKRFGDLPNYVEPFAGSLAVMLARPSKPRAETVNDKDCFIANFWRAMRFAPKELAAWADWPVNEADLHARHVWLVGQTEFRERMLVEPNYFDVQIAGWWVWGICQWIGGGWCSQPNWKKIPSLSRTGRGVPRKRPDMQRGGKGVFSKRPVIKAALSGVHKPSVARQLPQLGGAGSGSGRGVLRWGVGNGGLTEWFEILANRLRRVRVCCGDWERILGPSPTTHIGVTAVFLDPPYGEEAGRYSRGDGIYAEDDLAVAERVRQWAIEQGNDRKLRIALCGLEGEHEMPADWSCVAWKAGGGYSRGENENRHRERIWFSPHCLKPAGEQQILI